MNQQFIKNCPTCGDVQSYQSDSARNIAERNKAICKKCGVAKRKETYAAKIASGWKRAPYTHNKPRKESKPPTEYTFKTTPFTQALNDKSDGKELTEEQQVVVWNALTDLAKRKFVQCVVQKGFTMSDMDCEDWVSECAVYLTTYALEKFCMSRTKNMSHPVNFFAFCSNRFYTQKITRFVRNPEVSINAIQSNDETDHDGWDMDLHLHPNHAIMTDPNRSQKDDEVLDKYRTLWKEFYQWTQTTNGVTEKQRILFQELDKKLENSESIQFRGKEIWMSVFREDSRVGNNARAYATHTIFNLLLRWLRDTKRLPKESLERFLPLLEEQHRLRRSGKRTQKDIVNKAISVYLEEME